MIQILVALTLLSFSAFAGDDHDHDHGDDHGHGDEFVMVLKGHTPFGDACYLGVLEEETHGGYSVHVETSFSHGSAGPGELVLSLDNNNRLSANTRTAQMVVTLSGGTHIEDAEEYVVRWLHGSHWHTDSCEHLEVVDNDEWDGGDDDDDHDHDHGHGHHHH